LVFLYIELQISIFRYWISNFESWISNDPSVLSYNNDINKQHKKTRFVLYNRLIFDFNVWRKSTNYSFPRKLIFILNIHTNVFGYPLRYLWITPCCYFGNVIRKTVSTLLIKINTLNRHVSILDLCLFIIAIYLF
jgi:hypothetical protein